jgi:hypothetical protein
VTAFWPWAVVLEGVEGQGVRGVLVHGDHARERRMTGISHLSEHVFGGAGIMAGTQHEVQQGPRGIDGAVEVVPVLYDLAGGFIPAVRVGGRPQRRPTPLVQLWRIALAPAQHRGGVDPPTACPQKLFHVVVAQRIAHTLSHRTAADVGLNMAPWEQGGSAQGRSPVISDQDGLARGIRSPAMLATEPQHAGLHHGGTFMRHLLHLLRALWSTMLLKT